MRELGEISANWKEKVHLGWEGGGAGAISSRSNLAPDQLILNSRGGLGVGTG